MSLRAEYKIIAELDPEQLWDLTVTHKPSGRVIGQEKQVYSSSLDRLAGNIISAHMEKVTRIIEDGPIDPDKAEEADRLAHKADHDNQCEKELE